MALFVCVNLLLMLFIPCMDTKLSQSSKNKSNTSKSELDSLLVQEFNTFLEIRVAPINDTRPIIQNVEDFWKKRNAIADLETAMLFGNRMLLNKKETEVNRIILGYKYKEIDQIKNPVAIFPPSVSFYQAKELIQQSEIFKIIQKAPKGPNLFCFLETSVDLDFMYQLTFERDLYFYYEEDEVRFKYSEFPSAPGWRLLSELRNPYNTEEYVEDLDELIQESLSLKEFEGANEINSQRKLLQILQIYDDLITYKPNFIKVFQRILKIFYEDNIMYAEISYSFNALYDLIGNVYGPVQILQICEAILKDFRATHKNFIGVRFIYNPIFATDNGDLNTYTQLANTLSIAYPDLLMGFAVGETSQREMPISNWVEAIAELPKEMKLFYDAGFSKTWGTEEDYTLLDALVLNPAAIRMAYSIVKHPMVLEIIRENETPVEFSPLWGKGLNYITDLRDHPFASLYATDFPVVIGSAGGTLWNATGLSYEWYEVFMGMTPRFGDLRFLKQFAVNSWLCSNMPIKEKKTHIFEWLKQWHEFIDYIVSKYNV